MIDDKLLRKITEWFEIHKEQMLEDIIHLVRIESISDPASDCKPFGRGCLGVLAEMEGIARKHGFHVENHENYVLSIGDESKNWENTIGFWNHLDVVPVGENWVYEPFTPVRKGQFLIGRGAQDNKGPAIGILYMMKCIRELQLPMKHELCLFTGCDEERGMEDLAYYTTRYPLPKLSMIADSGFPVCYGEKGIIEGAMLSEFCVSDQILELYGGCASNMIPDYAAAVLKRTSQLELELAAAEPELEVIYLPDSVRLVARGTSKHSAFPEGSTNAIHELCKRLARLNCLEQGDRSMFEAIAEASEEYYGVNPGIAYTDQVSGPTTCTVTILKLEARKISVTLNIRYAITAESNEVLTRLGCYADEKSFEWKLSRHSEPNYFPKEHPAVKLLTDTYNELTGEQKEAFVMGGGTYARKLPNAFAYGIGGMQVSNEDVQAAEAFFGKGHGGAHEPDEALNIRLFIEAMIIYTMSIIAMNDCPLDPINK